MTDTTLTPDELALMRQGHTTHSIFMKCTDEELGRFDSEVDSARSLDERGLIVVGVTMGYYVWSLTRRGVETMAQCHGKEEARVKRMAERGR